MIHDPEILVLDEPTIGLDPNQIVEIRNLIKTLGREKTVIFCTHILSEVEATCDNVIIINKGKIVANGTPEQLQNSFAGKAVVKLEINQPADIVRPSLLEVAGVEEIKAFPENGTTRYELLCGKETDPRQAIFHKIVENNWVLLEMQREVSSLEDVFRQLTMGGDDE